MIAKLRSSARKLHHYLLPGSAFKRIMASQIDSEIELSLLPALVDERLSAVDVGANAGLYSRRLSELVGQVYSFEPHPRMAHILRANMPSNVAVTQAAVSNVDGHAQLRFPVNDGIETEVLGTIDPNNTAVSSAEFKALEVPTVRLDSSKLSPVGFIKIDVEGHELSVLEGAKQLIRRDFPTFLIEAEDRHRLSAVESIRLFLSQFDYVGISVIGRSIQVLENSLGVASMGKDQEKQANNFIFIHASRVSDTIAKIKLAIQEIR